MADLTVLAIQDLLALPKTVAELKTAVEALTAKVETLQRALPPTLVGVKEAAERLGVQPRTIRARVADGTLRSIKLGGQIRIDLASVQDAIGK